MNLNPSPRDNQHPLDDAPDGFIADVARIVKSAKRGGVGYNIAHLDDQEQAAICWLSARGVFNCVESGGMFHVWRGRQ